MGISIDSYRSRIGTFSNNREGKLKISYQNVTKHEQMKPKQYLKLLVMLAVIFAGSFQFPKDNLTNHPSGRFVNPSGRIVDPNFSDNPCGRFFHPSGRICNPNSYLNHPFGRFSPSSRLNPHHLNHPPGRQFPSDLSAIKDNHPCGRRTLLLEKIALGGKIVKVKHKFAYEIHFKWANQQHVNRKLNFLHWKICTLIVLNNENFLQRSSTFKIMSNFLARYTLACPFFFKSWS